MTGTTSQPAPDLIIIGASARAACFSAARAGFAPYWLDQFGDSDLRAAFPGALVSPVAYPAGLVSALEQAPHAPVIYTGALENHHRVLRHIAARRKLLGHSAEVCAAVRTPALLRGRLAAHGLGFPNILTGGEHAPTHGRWLQKPVRSGGGLGISAASPGTHATPGHYLQEFMPGENFSAVFVAGEADVRLLGITRQLVGGADFHAPAFSYCGSIGPVTPGPRVRTRWEEIGRVLAQEFGLRGLFGIDAIVRDDEVTVIEVNPRYTASVEVLEAALGVAAVALHMSAWGVADRGKYSDPYIATHGKACLFAPTDLVFDQAASELCHAPHGGNARNVQVQAMGSNVRGQSMRSDPCVGTSARFADIPAPGTPIPRAAPILTVLCRADTLDACAKLLRNMSEEVYKALGMAGSAYALARLTTDAASK